MSSAGVSTEDFQALKALLESRKTRIASLVSTRGARAAAPSACPVCGAEGSDLLRIRGVDGDTWRIVLCDYCGPNQGGLSPVPASKASDPDLAPGEIWRTSMLFQGDDDRSWEAAETLFVGVVVDAIEDAIHLAMREAEVDAPALAGETPQDEWIGGGLGPHAWTLCESEIFSGWPDRDAWSVMGVFDAVRFGDAGISEGVCAAVVNRAAGRGVWLVIDV